MKKITKALIGTGILMGGIGAAVGIAKAANNRYFDDFDDFDDDDDFFEETDDYDGDTEEE
jgi:hypothetical protein